MLTIRNTTGNIADVIASMRDIPARVVPFAASTALTRTAQIAAKKDLPDAMRRVFDRPTPYALNSLFVKPSTTDTLSARVMVKDSASRGVVPEKFLFPEVAGGPRGEKGFERALRYGGWLKSGEYAIPSSSAVQDAYGNVSGSAVRKLLKDLQAPKSKYFAGTVGIAKTRGIWERGTFARQGVKSKDRKVKPLFIFTRQPQYRTRLDFEGIALQAANANFQTEFNRAFQEMRAKGKA